MISAELLEILACPSCKGRIALESDEIVCQNCALRFPVRNGIPIMLVEEAKPGKTAPRGN